MASGRLVDFYGTFDLAYEVAKTLTDPWTIERQTVREGRSICTADRGAPCIDVLDHVVVSKGPRPADPPEGCARYTVCGRTLDLPGDLADALGLRSAWTLERAQTAIAIAFSEGLDGMAAALRAVAIKQERDAAIEERNSRAKCADDAIHAARIRRQAAMLECRAQHVSSEIGRD